MKAKSGVLGVATLFLSLHFVSASISEAAPQSTVVQLQAKVSQLLAENARLKIRLRSAESSSTKREVGKAFASIIFLIDDADLKLLLSLPDPDKLPQAMTLDQLNQSYVKLFHAMTHSVILRDKAYIETFNKLDNSSPLRPSNLGRNTELSDSVEPHHQRGLGYGGTHSKFEVGETPNLGAFRNNRNRVKIEQSNEVDNIRRLGNTIYGPNGPALVSPRQVVTLLKK